MIHQYAPLEATPTVSKSELKTSRTSARMARPASMRTMVIRSTSANAAIGGNTTTTEDHHSTATLLTTPTPPRSGKRARRFKSYSESGTHLERMVPLPRTRPYSAGDVEDLRRVTISGVSKNSKGTWMFKVDVGSDEWNTYVIRRRFTDFKELYDGLQSYESARVLPELPHHGIYSVFQLFVAPEKALNHRAERLQELLQCISTHPVLAGAAAFKNFIGKNPQSLELGYVSLSCYEAPTSENQLRLSASESSFVYERRLSN
ncbi:hypothetical protein Gpo141_00004311 [Globisporangium polare]